MSEQNAQPQQQRNGPGPVPLQVYCGVSRHELFELLEKYIENPRMYECFFLQRVRKAGRGLTTEIPEPKTGRFGNPYENFIVPLVKAIDEFICAHAEQY